MAEYTDSGNGLKSLLARSSELRLSQGKLRSRLPVLAQSDNRKKHASKGGPGLAMAPKRLLSQVLSNSYIAWPVRIALVAYFCWCAYAIRLHAIEEYGLVVSDPAPSAEPIACRPRTGWTPPPWGGRPTHARTPSPSARRARARGLGRCRWP